MSHENGYESRSCQNFHQEADKGYFIAGNIKLPKSKWLLSYSSQSSRCDFSFSKVCKVLFHTREFILVKTYLQEYCKV
jgi:hypothetical protein